eukprot:TRINITY_DN11076_c0_g1_i1.p1 TRINITY_DN11076_c0_g1~~TRINITY_DN11076_c0_g1_i1.p1  ORF type:complete len:516 (-),score=152.70 TRINITY_DN11076_c0_g1_i1:103-1650(-)
MKFFSAILSLCVLSTRAVELAYFEGRSGDIILQPKNLQPTQEGSYMMVNTPFGQQTDEISIEETSIADFISHLVGGPVVSSDASRDLLQSNSVFNKAKANLMFVLNDAEELPHLKSAQSGRRMDITRMSYPQDFTASLATISTGSIPSAHGIVADSWTSNYVDVNPMQTGAIVENLYDTMSRAFESKSLLYSVSSDQQTTWINAPHFETNTQISHNHAYYFDGQKGRVMNLGRSQGLDLTRAKILENLPRRFSSIEGVTMNGNQLVANIQNVEATFDASKKADMQFLTEIEMTYSVVDQLNTDAFAHLVADEIPDLYTFTYASLRSLSEKYGRSGPNYIAAQYILDEVVSDVTARFQQMYAGKLSIETLVQKSSISMDMQMDTKTMNLVYERVEKYLDGTKNQFKMHYPQIYVRSDVDTDTVCNQLTDLPFDVQCPEPRPFASFDDFLIYQSENNGTNNGTVNPDFGAAESFQITLWSSIILVVALILTLCAMANMDIGNDSMLYRGSGKGVPTI